MEGENTLPAVVESGDVDIEIADLRDQMRDGNSPYWRDSRRQARYRDLIAARDAGTSAPRQSGDVDSRKAAILKDPNYWKSPALQNEYRALCEVGTMPGMVATEAVDVARGFGMTRSQALISCAKLNDVEQALPDVNESAMQLPDAVQVSVAKEFGLPMPAPKTPSPDSLSAFSESEVGKLCHWGDDSARRLGIVQARYRRMAANLDENGRGWLAWFVDHSMQPKELAAVLSSLSE